MKIPKTSHGEIYRRVVEEKQSLKDVAEAFQCTKGRVSQIVSAFKKKLEQETV